MSVLHGLVREQVKKNRTLSTLIIIDSQAVKNTCNTKPSKQEKAAQGKCGFVPAVARWVLERSNAWMERCKIQVLNFERTLAGATAKLNMKLHQAND